MRGASHGCAAATGRGTDPEGAVVGRDGAEDRETGPQSGGPLSISVRAPAYRNRARLTDERRNNAKSIGAAGASSMAVSGGHPHDSYRIYHVPYGMDDQPNDSASCIASASEYPRQQPGEQVDVWQGSNHRSVSERNAHPPIRGTPIQGTRSRKRETDPGPKVCLRKEVWPGRTHGTNGKDQRRIPRGTTAKTQQAES